jgi:hypothetical protein
MSTSTPGSGVAGTPGSGVPGTPGSAGQSGGHSPLNTSSNLRRDHFAGKIFSYDKVNHILVKNKINT